MKQPQTESRKPHGGRFQAQGRILEKSENWAKDDPLYHCEAKVLISNLKEQLTRREMKIRVQAFKECEIFVDRANKNGGLEGFHSKCFPKNFKERVDLEVRRGIAFSTKPKQNEEKKV